MVAPELEVAVVVGETALEVAVVAVVAGRTALEVVVVVVVAGEAALQVEVAVVAKEKNLLYLLKQRW